jgi:hypothetical protein
MKHLKTYKLFESNDLHSDVGYIFLELVDKGYKVDVSMKPQGVDAFYMEVSNDNLFQWSDVEECITRSKDYTESNGWKLVKINLGFYGPVVRIREFMTFSGSNWSYFIHYITHPEFIQKNKIYEISLIFESNKHVMKLPNWAKTFEATGPLQPSEWSWTKDLTIPNDMQLDIHDMALELRDERYEISYQWWPPYEQDNKLYKDNKYPSINITKRDSQTGEGLEKIYYGHIKDFCDRVISYLDEMGYNGVVKFRKDNTNDYYEISDSNVNWGPFKDYPMAYSIHFKIEMISRRVYGDVYESNLRRYKLFESISKFPDQFDVEDIFLELEDRGVIEFVREWETGWLFFSTENLGIGSSIRSDLYSDMIQFPDNWPDKESEELGCQWMDIFLDLAESRNNYMLKKSCQELTSSQIEQAKVYTRINNITNKSFKELLFLNCEGGKISAYPIIRFNLGLFGVEKWKEVMECLERVWRATGFRPVNEIWTEDYVDEETGKLVKLYGASLQLVKCGDEEYKNLTSVYSERTLEKEMVSRFI